MIRCINKICQRCGDDRGSLLMETLLVIPLYLVLIGGIFWLGELMLAKQKLVVADRYAAWNLGNRHRDGVGPQTIQNELQQSLFPANRVGQQPIESVVTKQAGEGTDWSGPVGATVKLKMTMPSWTKGWLYLAQVLWGGTPPAETVYLLGRDIDDELHHVLLRRTKYGVDGVRTWKKDLAEENSQPWNYKVYNVRWPSVKDFSSGDGDGGRPSFIEYHRFDQYDQWSE
jgi:hypothetical protein